MIRSLQLLLALAWLLALAATPPAQAAATRMRVLFVVDSTAYMGELLGGTKKLAAASNALASVLPNHASKLSAGLLVYGHQISGQDSCKTLDRMQNMAPAENSPISELFGTLKTKGDAPISAALAVAASGKDIVDGQTAIILIAGGPESCHADPCEAAGKIAEKLSVPIHVIAVDGGGEAEALRSLKCVAENTKGGFWQVGSTMELAAALDDALALVVKLGGGAQPGGQQGKTAADIDAEAAATELASLSGTAAPAGALAAATGPLGSVSVAAQIADPGPPLNAGVAWRVYVSTGGAAGTLKLVTSSNDPAPKFTLPAGEYLVNAAYGRAYLTRKLKVTEAGSTEQFVLNAGGLKIGATLAGGSLAPAQLVVSEIFADERDQFGNRLKLVSGVKPGVVIRLNAGLYHVATTYGDANATVQTDVGVEAGKITDAMFSLTGSMVTFRLVQQSGGEALTGTSWTVFGEGGETVKHSLAALPTHILAAGAYSVAAERGGKTYTRDFTVTPSQPLQVELVAQGQ